jgi:MFS family permease
MQVASKLSPRRSRPLSRRARGRSEGWAVWGFAAGLYFVAVFHRMVLGVAAFEAERRYHVGPGALSAFTAIQLGVYLAMQVPVGLAADRIGPRRSLAAGMGAIAAGEAIFALSGTLGAGLAGRAMIGLGDAFVFINVLRVAHTWFEPRRAALLTALTSMLGALGQLLTTVPAHLALDGLGWTTTFAGAAAVTAVLAAGALGVVRDAPASEHAGATGADEAVAAAPAQDPVLATLRAAWSGRRTRMGFWAHFGLMTPFVTMTALWGYPWLVQAQGVPRETAATWLAFSVIALCAAAPFVGRLGGRGPAMQVRMALVTATLLVVAWAAVLGWPGGRPPHALILAALAISGVGSAVSVVAFMLARAGNPAHVAGSATGLVNCGGFLAGSLAILAAGIVLSHDGRSAAAFQEALAPMLGFSALSLVQVARLRFFAAAA